MGQANTQDCLVSVHPGRTHWMAKRGVGETLTCALAFLAYVPTLGFHFVYDDEPQIIQNPAIHAWRYLPNYFTSHAWAELVPQVHGNYYRPLFLLWFRLNHAIFGVHPEGWHFTSILCHVAATYLVFVVVRRLAASQWMAWSAATLFALHPVHIESVAWVSGVTDPLMAVFLLGGFLAYLRCRERHRHGWMGLALVLFSLGLLAKETAIVLGPFVFLYAWLYGERQTWKSRLLPALRQSLGFLGLTVLYLAVRAHVLLGLSHVVTPLSIGTIALTEPSIVWLYFRHLLLPIGLSGLYGLPYVHRLASAAFILPATLLLVLIVAVAWGMRRLRDARLAWFACGWMILPIVPVLWLPVYAEGDIAHDRYLYVPSIGFVLLISLFLAEIFRHWRANPRNLQFAGVAVLAAAYAFLNVTQQTYWATDLLLYTRAYTIAPQDNLICNDLGKALIDAGDIDGAITLFNRVLAREPGYWLSNYNLGYAYYKLGNYPQAEASFRRAISINTSDSDQYIYLGLCVWRQGRPNEAVEYMQHAIQIRPSAPGYHYALALLRREQNDLPAARSELNLELKDHPENMAARQQLDALPSGAAQK